VGNETFGSPSHDALLIETGTERFERKVSQGADGPRPKTIQMTMTWVDRAGEPIGEPAPTPACSLDDHKQYSETFVCTVELDRTGRFHLEATNGSATSSPQGTFGSGTFEAK
jgi:hypothetical protein